MFPRSGPKDDFRRPSTTYRRRFHDYIGFNSNTMYCTHISVGLKKNRISCTKPACPDDIVELSTESSERFRGSVPIGVSTRCSETIRSG